MGGKGGGGGSNVMQQSYDAGPATTGGWEKMSGPAVAAKPTDTGPKATEPYKAPPLAEAPGPAEQQPYQPPGWGNYPTEAANMSPLGDALVAGMMEVPGKAGPTNYTGQV